jgi:hypothetical protein
MNGLSLARSAVVFVAALLALAPAVTHAVALEMTPDPLGDWVVTSGATRVAQVKLQSGGTGPVSTLVLRTEVSGAEFQGSTVNFNFDFDADVVDANVTGSSGLITAGPAVVIGTGTAARLLAYACGQTPTPCWVDVTFEFATAPTTVDVKDVNNQFVNSSGGPSQELTATFARVEVSTPALGPAGLLALAAGLLVAGRRPSRRGQIVDRELGRPSGSGTSEVGSR